MSLNLSVKSIFSSKTFYGAVVALVAIVFPGFYSHALTAIGISDPGVIVDKIFGAVGAALAIYGRFTATAVTTLTGAPKS